MVSSEKIMFITASASDSSVGISHFHSIFGLWYFSHGINCRERPENFSLLIGDWMLIARTDSRIRGADNITICIRLAAVDDMKHFLGINHE